MSVPLTTEILLEQFERSLRAANKREATITHYVGAARQFLAWHGSGEFSRRDVEGWVVSLQSQYSEHTVVNRWKGLKAFADWLRREEELDTDPFAGLSVPKADEVPKDVVSPEDMARMFKKLEREKRWRDAVIVALLYDTGMRLSEMCSLRLEDIDLKTGLIMLNRTKGRRPRMVRLSMKGVTYIDRMLRRRKQSPWLVLSQRGTPMTPSGCQKAVRRWFEEIGVPGITPHDLRHTSASHVAGELSTEDFKALYGWKDSKMVEHYTRQVRQATAIEAHKRVSPLERLG